MLPVFIQEHALITAGRDRRGATWQQKDSNTGPYLLEPPAEHGR
jgi:hypothetical protein